MVDKQIIICVDDEQIVLTSLVAQLRRTFGRRFDYETFTSAEEALEYVDELYAEGESIALIVTDWLMPKVRGDQFLVNVKRRYDDVPMIMLSGHADENAVQRAKNEANLFKFIGKPWQVEELTKQAALAMGLSGDIGTPKREGPRPVLQQPVQQPAVQASAPQATPVGQQSNSPRPVPMFAKRKPSASVSDATPSAPAKKSMSSSPFMLPASQRSKDV